MRTTRRALCAVPIVLAFFLTASCNNAYGIFSNVQDEVAQKGTKVFQKTPVSNAFLLGTKYYAAIAGGTLQARDAGTAHGWSRVSIVGGSYSLRSAVLAGANIYALIEADGKVAAYRSANGVTWSSVTLPTQTYTGTNTFAFDRLFATSDSQVYAEGHAFDSLTLKSTYPLYFWNGAAFVQVNGASNELVPVSPADDDKSVRGVVFDGTAYWFATENKLIRGTTANGSDATSAIALFEASLAGKTIWSISYTSYADNKVYVTTKDGQLYQVGILPADTKSLSTSPLTCVADVPGNLGTLLLVGSDALNSNAAVGYYEGTWALGFALGSTNTQVALNSSIFSTTVSAFPVHAFYYDGNVSAGKLFICVSPGSASAKSYGLYSSDWNGSAWSGWQAE